MDYFLLRTVKLPQTTYLIVSVIYACISSYIFSVVANGWAAFDAIIIWAVYFGVLFIAAIGILLRSFQGYTFVEVFGNMFLFALLPIHSFVLLFYPSDCGDSPCAGAPNILHRYIPISSIYTHSQSAQKSFFVLFLVFLLLVVLIGLSPLFSSKNK